MQQVTLSQALQLLGLMTLRYSLLEEQCEGIANEFNIVRSENERLQKQVEELNGRLEQTNNS